MEHLVESSQAETAALPLSPSVTENPESSNLPQEPQTDYLAIGAAAKDVDFKDVADTASDSSCGIQVSSKRKAEDSKSEEAEENRKPTEKKARLVAYDACKWFNSTIFKVLHGIGNMKEIIILIVLLSPTLAYFFYIM